MNKRQKCCQSIGKIFAVGAGMVVMGFIFMNPKVLNWAFDMNLLLVRQADILLGDTGWFEAVVRTISGERGLLLIEIVFVVKAVSMVIARRIATKLPFLRNWIPV